MSQISWTRANTSVRGIVVETERELLDNKLIKKRHVCGYAKLGVCYLGKLYINTHPPQKSRTDKWALSVCLSWPLDQKGSCQTDDSLAMGQVSREWGASLPLPPLCGRLQMKTRYPMKDFGQDNAQQCDPPIGRVWCYCCPCIEQRKKGRCFSWTLSYKQNSSVEFFLMLELTNHINHGTNLKW